MPRRWRWPDRHVIYKNGVKEIAYLQGKAVSFMAKWRADLAGNSCHIHGSLWDAGDRPMFSDGHGETELFRQFLAGLLAVGGDMTYFLAPYINSYKRFQAGSFAPTNLVWSRDNRTSGFRVLGHGPGTRVECRVGGADVNPYLAFAAFLAAGLHGIEQKLTLQPAFQGDAYKSGEVPAVPATLRDAVERLDGSAVLRKAMGRRGDRPLCPCRPLGTRRVRQGGHRLGADALLRTRLASARSIVTLPWTLALLAFGLLLAGLARWHESRPRELGQVGLIPTTLVMAIGVIAAVLAAAHLVSLLTGIPLSGRYGR